MPSVTALEMLNRVRLYRRQPTTDSFATPEDVVTLNALNMAIEDVLSTRKWEFDLRHNGQLTLRGKMDDVFINATSGSSVVNLFTFLTAFVDADVLGEYVVRLVASGVANHASTPFRVKSSSGAAGGTGFTVLDAKFPEDAALAATSLHYAEYILPDTVGEVIRASYKEEQIRLEQADPTVRYDELFPNGYDTAGSPEVVAVGGFDTPTYDSRIATPEPGLRMAVWPVPDDAYVIDYSYYYKHPELVTITDTLQGVPNAVVNDIILKAASIVMMTWDQNYAAAHFTDMSEQQAALKHRAYGGSSGRRHTINSFENGSAVAHVHNGFPGKLIG